MAPILLCCCLLAASAPATVSRADRSYTVRSGDTLASIARRHRTTVSTLQAANRLRGEGLRPGQVLTVPERGVVYVEAGDTLARIARRHEVTVSALARANRLRDESQVRIGQRLLLPGHQPAQDRQAAERRWGTPRHPGVVTLVRMGSGRRERMRLVQRNGRVRRAAIDRMVPLMRDRRQGRRSAQPHRRLLAMLAQVSDHFGGRPLYIVSGFRAAGGFTRATSQHTRGRAIDFRVSGVPNTAVRDYCRGFPQAGVGFYPRSTFVHLDARDQRRYWVDDSRPGERPMYRRDQPGEEDPSDEVLDAADAADGDDLAQDDEDDAASAAADPSF